MRRKREQQFDTVCEFLSTQSTLVLSTCSAEGEAYATPLFYLPDESLCLFWVSSAKSRHSLHTALHPQVSVAIFHATEHWREIVGVQMNGVVDSVTGTARKPILDAYGKRFGLGRVLSAAAARSRLYRFRPTWVRYIDNRRRFGFKFELELE